VSASPTSSFVFANTLLLIVPPFAIADFSNNNDNNHHPQQQAKSGKGERMTENAGAWMIFNVYIKALPSV